MDYVIDEHRLIITTNYIIAEFVARGCSKCHMTRDRLFKTVDSILNLPKIEIVHIGEKSHVQAMRLLRGHLDKEWSLVDATSFNVMRERGITEALTTDRDFAQAGFIRLLVLLDET